MIQHRRRLDANERTREKKIRGENERQKGIYSGGENLRKQRKQLEIHGGKRKHKDVRREEDCIIVDVFVS